MKKSISEIVSIIIYLKISYYLALLIIFGSEVPNPLIYTVPSLFFSVVLFLLIIRNSQFKKSSYLLFLFIGASLLTGIVNNDIMIFITTFMFTIPLLVVNEVKFSLAKHYLYVLYLVIIVVGVVSFHLGLNQYGYLPGHSLLYGNTPWWRINLFPNSTPTYTGFLGVIYFAIGAHYYLRGKNKTDLFVIISAVYLTALSGSRTALLILFGAIFIFYFRERKKVFQHLLPYIIIAIPLLIFASNLIFFLSDDELTRDFLLRGTAYDAQGVSEYSRFILWEYLFGLYKENPIFGIGRFSVLDYFPWSSATSEARWLYLLASNGIFVSLLLLYVIINYHLSVERDCFKNSVMILMLIVSMMFYGSMFVPYNYIYFMNIYVMYNYVNRKHE